jgi:hypothetical protein
MNENLPVNVIGGALLLISVFGYTFIERANGEARPAHCESRVIPSEALGSVDGSTKEPLETRTTSNACSNWSHECPATNAIVEDIVQYSRKLESWDKEPSEDIETV